MNRQQTLIAIGLLLSTSIVALGRLRSEEEQRSRLQRLHTKAARKTHLTSFDRAYLDVISLLEHGNICSEFFGGVASEQVVDNFAITLKTGLISDPRIGLVMSGRSTHFFDSKTGISYRLFADAEINRIGPFYKSKVWPEDPFIPNVGQLSAKHQRGKDPHSAS